MTHSTTTKLSALPIGEMIADTLRGIMDGSTDLCPGRHAVDWTGREDTIEAAITDLEETQRIDLRTIGTDIINEMDISRELSASMPLDVTQFGETRGHWLDNAPTSKTGKGWL